MMRSRSLIVLAFICLVIADLHAQKNILRIRFDTVTVEKLPTQVFLNVYCKFEGTKPHQFRGFECRIAYEKYQIDQPIVVWTGTVCENAAFHKYNILSADGQILIQVLNPIELDLTKPVLFRLGFQAKSTLNDTVYGDYRGLFECFRFDDSLSNDNGIDEVIIENNKLGWIDYKPPVVIDTTVRRTNIVLSTTPAEVPSDSIVTIGLNVSSLDSASIERGAFQFRLDTAVLSFVDAEPGPVLGTGGKLTVENTTDKVIVYFSGADSLKSLSGTGELMRLRFKAHKREDTVCTILVDTALYALNDSARVDTIFYDLGQVCVLGHKEDVGVVENPVQQPMLRIVPNPACDEIRLFYQEARSFDLFVWNVLGELVEQRAITADAALDLRHYVPGTYRVVLRQNGQMLASAPFVIIR